MSTVPRHLIDTVRSKLFKGKTIIVLGPRQVGKTTLLETLRAASDDSCLLLDCDEPDTRKSLTGVSSTELKALFGNHRIVMIDEAQRVHDIGLTLKLAHDKLKETQIVVTGSSALELSNEVNEPLTGRKLEYIMFPLSLGELDKHHGRTEESRLIERRLVFGTYPDVVNSPGEEADALKYLTSAYLYKDIFNFQEVRRPELIEKLLEALALQIGSEVSYNELAQTIGADPVTVERYLGLLERSFVVFRLRSFSRNMRNELKKSRKVYFYDNGIRNALLSDFTPIDLRTDKGALWENFLVSERMKFISYNAIHCNRYFWRTHQQQEIDYLEERGGELHAFEFKWSADKKPRLPKSFSEAYPKHSFTVVNRDNYRDFTG